MGHFIRAQPSSPTPNSRSVRSVRSTVSQLTSPLFVSPVQGAYSSPCHLVINSITVLLESHSQSVTVVTRWSPRFTLSGAQAWIGGWWYQ